jgi:hypothetical protein
VTPSFRIVDRYAPWHRLLPRDKQPPYGSGASCCGGLTSQPRPPLLSLHDPQVARESQGSPRPSRRPASRRPLTEIPHKPAPRRRLSLRRASLADRCTATRPLTQDRGEIERAAERAYIRARAKPYEASRALPRTGCFASPRMTTLRPGVSICANHDRRQTRQTESPSQVVTPMGSVFGSPLSPAPLQIPAVRTCGVAHSTPQMV